MDSDDQRAWMWADAVDMLARAERVHRQMFQPQGPGVRAPSWEPPVDVIETEREVLILAALPGVDPEQISAVIHEDGMLVISGHRSLPREFQTAAIHRLELPQGRFERRVLLPAGRYQGAVRQGMNNGCLVISLVKAP
jgi:HSP20 family protein